MAFNDFVLIDGIVDDILDKEGKDKNNGQVRGTAFERLAISELLKVYDLTTEQIENGIVDGGDDGGIDGFFIFVNGNYLSDTAKFNWPRENGKLELYIITCKHDNSYSLSPLESLDSSLSELLNFSIPEDGLIRKHNKKVLKKRQMLYTAYRKLAAQNVSPVINLYYISRGDLSQVPENIRCAGDKVKTTCNSIFQNALTTMKFWGTKELITQIRKKRNAPIEIRVQRFLQLDCNYVVLANLDDYIKAVIDEDGKLKRYLFNENVRDYLGENHTNSAIMDTLKNEQSPDFWLLNNGITILTSNAILFDNTITVEDVQIVNGLQTTFTIFSYYENGNSDISERKILIKVIKPDTIEVSKTIIKATNTQSAIPLYALHANDKIQKDVEDILFRNGLYYERRPKYYTNLGYSPQKIIAPLYLASGYVALILKLPHRAATLKSKFMDNQAVCDKVFSESVDIKVWPVIASVLKRTDAVTEQYRDIVKKSTEKYLRSVRYVISLVTLARMIGKYSFGVNDLVKLDVTKYSKPLIRESTESLIAFINESELKTVGKMSDRDIVNAYLQKAAIQFSLPDFCAISNRPDLSSGANYRIYEISPEFLQTVYVELPAQPWPTGIHKVIAQKLNCPAGKVSQAINHLIEQGRVYRQVNGVVYDDKGHAILQE